MTSRAKRWTLAAAALAALLAGVLAGASAGRPRGQLEFERVGRVVPARFVGFSIEYGTLGGFMGLPQRPANPLLAQTWATTGSGITVRVGGNSADRAWPAGWPRQPATIRFPVTDAWWHRLDSALRAGGARVALTLNLAAGRPDATAEMLRRARAQLPADALAEIQLGNEPDLYGQPRWRVDGGTPTGLRTARYRFEDFVAEQRAALAVLRTTGIPFRLTGPGFGSPAWRQQASRYLAAGFDISGYGSHVYPLSNCRDKGAHLRPQDLLRASTSARAAAALSGELGAARAAKLPLVVQEGNSAACRGKPGVSDHPYSALWAADQLFTLVQAGAAGYFFHTSNGSYDPYAFRWTGRGWQVHLAPEYLGLLLFEHATAPGARLLELSGMPEDVAAWATRDRAGTVRVLLLNRSTSRPERVTVPGAQARVLSVTTAHGLRVGAHPWPRWQSDARIDLGRYERTLTGRDGRLAVTLPAASAVVLTLPARRSR